MMGMPLVLLLVGIGVGAGAGGAVAWLWAAARERTRGEVLLRAAEGEAKAARASADEVRHQLSGALERAERLDGELCEERRVSAVAETQAGELRARLDEQRALLDEAQAKLGEAFRAAAAEALAANNEGFLALAAQRLEATRVQVDGSLQARQQAIEALLGPVRESLEKVDGKIQAIERERVAAYARLTQMAQQMAESSARLGAETANLVKALRAPAARGRWGEIQLRRVVELAGMVEHCDFGEQETLSTDDGRLRPDMIVRMPGGRRVVVDAKAPLEAYLDALEAQTEQDRRARLGAHAAQVRAHVQKLGAKSYWAGLDGPVPEFVILFLPSEAMFSAALEAMPGLLEEGVGRRVLIATPTTLIALLQTVHHGWRQEKLAENAQKISEQGRLLHERLATLLEHWMALGKALGKATDCYNESVASLERRVIPAVRRLEDLGAAGKKEIGTLLPIDARARVVVALEPRALPPEGALLSPEPEPVLAALALPGSRG